MTMSRRRALLVATAVSAGWILGCAWPLSVLFGHADPIFSLLLALGYSILFFVAALVWLRLRYGPFVKNE